MNAHIASSATRHPRSQSSAITRPDRQSSDWQATAVAVYTGAMDAARLQLRRRLAERLLALTGRETPEGAVATDAGGQSASAVVDGVLFLLRHDDLVIMRPCAYCQTGRFVSEPLDDQAGLGYALAVWAPYHRDCEPTDPPEDTSW
jgi:hypothetical protein